MPALNTLTNLWLTGEADVEEACKVSESHNDCTTDATKMIEQAASKAKDVHSVLVDALVEGAEERLDSE